jgi:hypothetical protein
LSRCNCTSPRALVYVIFSTVSSRISISKLAKEANLALDFEAVSTYMHAHGLWVGLGFYTYKIITLLLTTLSILRQDEGKRFKDYWAFIYAKYKHQRTVGCPMKM